MPLQSGQRLRLKTLLEHSTNFATATIRYLRFALHWF